LAIAELLVLLGKVSIPPILTKNSMVGDFGSSPTQTFTFYCGKPEVDLGEILVGTGRPLGELPSVKIWKRSGMKWGAQIGVPNLIHHILYLQWGRRWELAKEKCRFG